MGTRSAWTPERRARQRKIIAATQPWRSSTGPRSVQGKAKSALNAQAFRKNPGTRRAWILIHDFFRSGEMTPELAEVLIVDQWLNDGVTITDDQVAQTTDK